MSSGYIDITPRVQTSDHVNLLHHTRVFGLISMLIATCYTVLMVAIRAFHSTTGGRDENEFTSSDM